MTPAEWVEMLIRKGHDLRAAGVLTLSIGDVSITLAPLESEPAGTVATSTTMTAMERIAAGQTDGTYLDIMDDPRTYGRVTGTPGFERPRDDES